MMATTTRGVRASLLVSAACRSRTPSLTRTLTTWNATSTVTQQGFLSPPVTFGYDQVRTSKQQTRFLSTAAAHEVSAANVQLYQYAICPFCNRVKAVLDFATIPYETTEVNPLTKSEIKPWKKQHNKVPIAVIDGNPVFESDVIIGTLLGLSPVEKALEDRLGDHMTVEIFRNGPSAKQWTDFATNKLAVLLYPNICRSWGESYRAFEYVNRTPTFGFFQRILIQNVGSLAMYMAASKIKKRLAINDERQALEDVLVVLEKELESKFFLSGKKMPDLGDLYVYGTLRAIRGLPVYETLVDDRGGPIFEWCERMETQLVK